MFTENKVAVATQVVNELKARGYDSEVMVVNKNGADCVGITIGNGTVRPQIYPDFDLPIDEIADKLIQVYKNDLNSDTAVAFADMFSNYESIKELIVPYLTKGDMPDAASHKYLDLNVYYKVIKGDMGVKIKKSHLELWGVSEQEIFIQAKMNMKNKS